MANQPYQFGYRWRYALLLTSLLTGLPIGITSPNVVAQVLVVQQSTHIPQTIAGELTPNSPTLEDDGSYYEAHTLEGSAGEALTIDLISDDFDAYLILVSPTGEHIAQDDDSAGGTVARRKVVPPGTT